MSKKKHTGKYESRKPRKKPLGLIVTIVLVILAACMALLLYSSKNPDSKPVATAPHAAQTETAAAKPQEITTVENSVNLGYGIYVTDIGSYTGVFMEDGSDEVLPNILMMIVKNGGEQDIQYAEIAMDVGDTQAVFKITTLPVGESMVLLEQNRMTFSEETDYAAILPKVETVAYFQTPVSLQEDKLDIGIVDGALNVTNISGADISGTIRVYYKNAAEDLLYGGITYQVTIEGGLKSGEIRQVMTKHASDAGSRILFVTIAP